MAQHQPTPSGITAVLIAPFLKSVKTVMQMMANVETTIGTPHLKVASTPYNVFGIIGFSGEVAGTVTVSFTLESARNVVEAFTGSAVSTDSVEFVDAIGELANMIAGSAKSNLGFAASISVPSVVVGSCKIASLSAMPCVVIPCQCSLGQFAVEVCISSKRAA